MFLSSLIINVLVARKKTGAEKNKSTSRIYYLKVPGGSKERFYLKFFISTFNISHRVIETCMQQIGESGIYKGNDVRIGKIPPNKTNETDIKFVKKHIDSFPRMESHYSRRDTSKVYLSPDLNLSTMYRLYQEEFCPKANISAVSLRVYSKVFHSYSPQLSFFIPKKDQCPLCNQHVSGTEDVEWENHRRRADEAMKMKEIDKKKSTERNGSTYRAITFDLQAVLSVPYAADNQLYYKRKLNIYNFTIYDGHNQDGLCFLWDEANGRKGSSEIGTCLLKYLSSLPESVQHVSSFSDTCGGQTRTKNASAAMLYAVNKYKIEIIDLKFMESGHSYLEADSIHSIIERARKHKKLYTTREWALLISGARKKPRPYIVETLLNDHFFDLKDLASKTLQNTSKNTEGEQVNWLKIKWLRFSKSKPRKILYKYNLSDEEFFEFDIDGKKRGNKFNWALVSLLLKYPNKINISEEKKKDLRSLMQVGIIPPDYVYFYEPLLK